MANKLALLVAILLLSSCAAWPHISTSPRQTPEVWMTHFQPGQLAAPDAQWSYVQDNLNVLDFYINSLIWFTPDQLRPLIKTLNDKHIKIAIECGLFDWENPVMHDWTGPKDQIKLDIIREDWTGPIGEQTARMEIAKIQNLILAGGKPACLNLDDSIRRMMRPGQDVSRSNVKGYDSLDRCLDELVAYLRVWREAFPDIQFFTLVNFPNWGWKGDTSYWNTGMFNGDYATVLPQLARKTKAAGVPLQGLTVDFPYEYATGAQPHDPWMHYPAEITPTGEKDPAKVIWMERLAGLEKMARQNGLEFNIIINSQAGGMASGAQFVEKTLEYLDYYQAHAPRPDRVIIQSWYPHPEHMSPETAPDTMTAVVKRAIEKLKK